jgi:hypothetical protein
MELEIGAPDRIRTCDLCLRRAALYPAELRALGLASIAEFRRHGNALAPKAAFAGPVGVGRLDEGFPMPHCPAFAAQEERLARFLFSPARRRGFIRVPGRRSRRSGRTGQFRQRRPGRPDPGLSGEARRSGSISGRRSSAHLSRPAG